MKTRLGLDVGTNSLGWSLVCVDDNFAPTSLIDSGVRIFSDGRQAKNFASLKADRRLARQARRRRDRYLRRRQDLMKALIRHGLMPPDPVAQKTLELLDPYKIRQKAVHEKCPPHHVGRALFHLNQRRGFKSNRKTVDKDTGPVKESIQQLKATLEAEGAKTLGDYLATRHEKGETVRARRAGTTASDLYDLYPSRELYEAEFDAIWTEQNRHEPNLFSDSARDEIRKIIFFQRKLKPPKPGLCAFIRNESRIARALPSFQRFRIFQEALNLQWIDKWQNGHAVVKEKPLFDYLINQLEQKRKVTFKSLAKMLKTLGIVDYDVSFNLESEKRAHLDGNQVSCEMRHENRIGAGWDEWSEHRQDDLIALLIDHEKEDEEVLACLEDDFDIPSEDQRDAIMTATLPSGFGSLSKAAIDKILPKMRDEKRPFWKAVEKAGLGDHNLYDPNKPLLDRLPYYGEALNTDVLPGTGDPDEKNDEIRYGTIPNPTVHIALNQIRQVVNELIRRYGKPDQIVIELARDLPAGAEGRLETIRFQSENQRTNDRIREELVALGEEDNRANRQKFQLWEDLAKDPTDRRCLFTGQMIGKHQLYSGEIEIEHLLPYSRTWDDSMANKTVCFTRANRYKGNQSPFEAFGHSPGEYNWADILGRITTLKKSKQWRFREDAMTRFEEEGKFLPRHIVSTQYISRYTRKYLSSVVDQNNVYVVTGKLTAMLRGHWGLNSVLRGDNLPEDAKAKKLRDDHRHHAIDAIVIAMTSRSILQRVATAAGKGETQFLEKLFVDKRDIDPWPGFRMDVMEQMDKLVVSHRVRHKNQGQLHNDTAYGFVTGKPGKAVHRIPVESFVNDKKLDLIRDDYIRKQLKDVTYGLSGQEFKEAVLNWCSKQYCEIKSLRISVEGFVDDKKLDLICDDNIRVQLKDVTDGLLGQDFKEAILNWCSKQYPVIKSLRIPVEGIENAEILDLICDDNIRGQLKVVTYGLSGPEFKEAVLNWCSKQYYTIKSLRVIESISLIAIKDKNGAPYKGYKPDGNAYMDIFPDDKGKWQGEVVRRFDASNPKFIPEWRQARPAQKRIMQLRIDDILKIEEQGNATFLRVQRLSKGIVVLAPLNEANVDARNRNPEDDFMFTYKSPSALQKLKAVKVHISPTGLIREAR